MATYTITGSGDVTDEAIAALATLNTSGGVLEFPADAYTISAPLRASHNRVHIKGAGANATVITRNFASGNVFEFYREPSVGAYITGCRISGMTIYSPTVPTSGASIYANYADTFSVDDVILSDGKHGIVLAGCQKVKLSNITMRWSSGNSANRRFVRLLNTTEAYAGLGGRLHGSNIMMHNLDCASQYSSGVSPSGADYGLEVVGVDGMILSDSYFGGCSGSSLLFNNASALPNFISGVKVHGCWLDHGEGCDIIIQGNASQTFGNMMIANNTFGGGPDDTYGIVAGGNASNLTIANNLWFGGNKNDYINIGSGVTRFSMHGNTGKEGLGGFADLSGNVQKQIYNNATW